MMKGSSNLKIISNSLLKIPGREQSVEQHHWCCPDEQIGNDPLPSHR